jgi:hypothetical protein
MSIKNLFVLAGLTFATLAFTSNANAQVVGVGYAGNGYYYSPGVVSTSYYAAPSTYSYGVSPSVYATPYVSSYYTAPVITSGYYAAPAYYGGYYPAYGYAGYGYGYGRRWGRW